MLKQALPRDPLGPVLHFKPERQASQYKEVGIDLRQLYKTNNTNQDRSINYQKATIQSRTVASSELTVKIEDCGN
jgi:hypothetical protein